MHFFSKRGSTILSVVLFTTVALLIIGSLLSWSMTERRLNYRHALRLEARNAAEALAEYGFSQIRQKMETHSTLDLKPTGTDALIKPPSDFWTGSDVQVADNELIGGKQELVPANGSSYYFNPTDPNNENDPLNGKHVFRRDIRVIAKATVNPAGTTGGAITAYVSQRISIRGAPLFAHAIFYNMDLEIFNGPTMTISGPVHSNGSLYLYPQTGALTFTDTVSATGRIYHAAKPGDGSNDGASAAGRKADVNFPDKSGNPKSIKVDGVWKDSTQGNGTAASDWADFRDYSSQRWNGNLQTVAHGVDNYTPVAIGKYKEDATPSNGTDDSLNSGRTIIEPTNYPTDTTAADYSQKLEVEQQKYASDAGIYITADPSTGDITITSRSKNPTSPGEYKNKTLTLPAGNTLVTYHAYATTTTSQKAGSKITTNPNKNKYPITTTTTVTSAKGTTTSTEVTYSSSSSTAATSKVVSSGMYDQHRQKEIDLIDLDMDALRKAVAHIADSSSAKISTGATVSVTASDIIGNLDKNDWTGIVYVEVKGGPTTDSITGATNSATIPQSLQTSVRIVNGKGQVASYGTDNPGLTIATNAPVYIKGSFNADGVTSDSSPTTPETGEVPAAIVGDAVTILSEGFNDETSLSSPNPAATSASSPATPGSIEVAAALLVGVSITNKDGNKMSSGGAHNLPRFLENWDGKSVFIRGSLVALFETRVFTEPHGSGYYSPPARNWGFNNLFRDGHYPPGTPRVLSYRRVDFTDMNAAEYEAAKASFNW
ncbi:MAG: hypothetical protein WC205_04895 [Opitutaceae bacterium]|jgi:hypothetical protein